MATESDVTQMHEEIDKTRADLTEKLQTLEEQVLETVSSARENVSDTIEQVTSSVENTIEQVSSSVNDTVTQVRQTFDLNYQVRERPWTMVGASVVTGFVIGTWITMQSRGRAPSLPSYGGREPAHRVMEQPSMPRSSRMAAEPASPPAPRGPGLWSSFLSQFDDEIEKVKELAIGYAAGAVRDLLKEAVPAVRQQIDEVMNSATRKMGGEPVSGPVLHSSEPSSQRIC